VAEENDSFAEWIEWSNPEFEYAGHGNVHDPMREYKFYDNASWGKNIPQHLREPEYYSYGAKEAIEIMADLGVLEEYCVGNIIKYLYRYKHKGKPLEDIQKAGRYIEILMSHLGNKKG